MSSNNKRITELRHALSSDNRHERAQAAIQLGYENDRGSIDLLRDLAADPDDLVAIAAMFGSWQLNIDVVSIQRMAAALSSSDEELIQESVFALCEMGEAIVPKLEALLEEHSPYANSILRVLADIGGEKAFDAITNYKSDDPSHIKTVEELLGDRDE